MAVIRRRSEPASSAERDAHAELDPTPDAGSPVSGVDASCTESVRAESMRAESVRAVARPADGEAREPLTLGRILGAASPLLVLAALTLTGIPACPSRLFLGLPCPGCGLTRATFAMLHGDVHGVLHYHPLAPILTPLFVTLLGSPLLALLGITWPSRMLSRVPNWLWGALLTAFVGLYVARAGGLLGGLPDPVDLRAGVVGRVLERVLEVMGSLVRR